MEPFSIACRQRDVLLPPAGQHLVTLLKPGTFLMAFRVCQPGSSGTKPRSFVVTIFLACDLQKIQPTHFFPVGRPRLCLQSETFKMFPVFIFQDTTNLLCIFLTEHGKYALPLHESKSSWK